jgi:AcrR family transcriptional regulator
MTRASWIGNSGFMMGRKIDMTRRAEIGAEKRIRTRNALLAVARELFGHEGGKSTRIEEICEGAGVARGTFYNYFPGIDAVQEALFEELSRDFDEAIHLVFPELESATERTAAAIRYYIGRARHDPRWGWGMVNTGMGTGLLTNEIAERVEATIQEGMDSGEFDIGVAIAGRDLLLGTGLAATITLLKGEAPPNYPELTAARLLMALGVNETQANAVVRRPLPDLPIAELR